MVQHSTEPMFERQRDGRFLPSPRARSGWGADLINGGLPAALLARAVERANPDPGMRVARLTVDLFRPVPARPLEVRAREVRRGGRLAVYEAGVFVEGAEVTRGSALLLRPAERPASALPVPALGDPEALEPSGFPGAAEERAAGRGGFFAEIDVRWASEGADGSAPAAWFRLPMPLVGGEETTPLMRAAVLSDFANRLSQIARARAVAPGSRPGGGSGYINTDITVSLHRYPAGEWIALVARDAGATEGIGLAEAVHVDRDGAYGTCAQVQLANDRREARG